MPGRRDLFEAYRLTAASSITPLNLLHLTLAPPGGPCVPCLRDVFDSGTQVPFSPTERNVYYWRFGARTLSVVSCIYDPASMIHIEHFLYFTALLSALSAHFNIACLIQQT